VQSYRAKRKKKKGEEAAAVFVFGNWQEGADVAAFRRRGRGGEGGPVRLIGRGGLGRRLRKQGREEGGRATFGSRFLPGEEKGGGMRAPTRNLSGGEGRPPVAAINAK